MLNFSTLYEINNENKFTQYNNEMLFKYNAVNIQLPDYKSAIYKA